MPIDLSTYTGTDLLTDADRNEFRGAMMDIKATFHKTPVTYLLAGTTFSRFNEDRRKDTAFVTYNLMGSVEYSQLVQDQYVWSSEGATPEAKIKVTFNTDYLDQQGLWDSTKNVPLLNGKKDQMIIGGAEYRITEIPVPDGMIEARSVHTVVFAEPIIKPTK